MMNDMNIIEYKGYHTRVECSLEDGVLFGRIEGIRDLVTFECESITEAELEFHKAVDDYLEFCTEVGKEPEKEYKGQFNIRIDPELHRAAAVAAFKEGVSLNSFVAQAIREKLTGEKQLVQYFITFSPIIPKYETGSSVTAKGRFEYAQIHS